MLVRLVSLRIRTGFLLGCFVRWVAAIAVVNIRAHEWLVWLVLISFSSSLSHATKVIVMTSVLLLCFLNLVVGMLHHAYAFVHLYHVT